LYVEPIEFAKRVLVVEDYEFDAFLIARILARLPYPVIISSLEEGSEAIRLSEIWHPLEEFFDLILLDSRLQGHSGLDVLQAFRRSDPTGTVPIVLLIGAAGDDFSEIAMGHGATACIVKPLDPDAFEAKLHRIAATWLQPS
jgi:CheY-like chemotaxis protein